MLDLAPVPRNFHESSVVAMSLTRIADPELLLLTVEDHTHHIRNLLFDSENRLVSLRRISHVSFDMLCSRYGLVSVGPLF